MTGSSKVTVLCAAAVTVALTAASVRRTTSAVLPAMGVFATAMMTATAWYDTVHLRHIVAASGRLSDGIITTHVGVGLWVVDLAAVVASVGAMLALRECRRRRSDMGFEVALPRSAGDLVVSRTVVVRLPQQRDRSETSAETADR